MILDLQLIFFLKQYVLFFMTLRLQGIIFLMGETHSCIWVNEIYSIGNENIHDNSS